MSQNFNAIILEQLSDKKKMQKSSCRKAFQFTKLIIY